jgi:hypothetical protein
MQFDSKPTPAALQTMIGEADKLLKGAGISLDWRLAKENRGNEAFSKLVMLRFKGACRADRFPSPETDFGTLGETRALGFTKVARGGKVLPYTEVECDEIRQALAYLDPTVGEKERQKALGRAMGRVVAHELYHILAHTTKHAAQGLAKATQSLQDLVARPDLGFRAEDSRAIGQGVAQ